MKNLIEINKELSTSENLLMVWQTGSDETKLVDHILHNLEQQQDAIYIFVSQDIIDHSGDRVYDHKRLLFIDDIDDDTPVLLENTALIFPYLTYPDDLLCQLYTYIEELSKRCLENNRKLFIISDGLDNYSNHGLMEYFKPYKRIIFVYEKWLEELLKQMLEYHTVQFKIIKLGS